jgi:hypothetical protein
VVPQNILYSVSTLIPTRRFVKKLIPDSALFRTSSRNNPRKKASLFKTLLSSQQQLKQNMGEKRGYRLASAIAAEAKVLRTEKKCRR